MSNINLKKRERINLTKDHPNVTRYAIGLGWDVNSNVGADFDLDASAFIQGARH